MFIGRIHLRGFKSFGGSHDIPLAGSFTAVVGPNGSGKSNILDALRWVLGDSNPGRLRIMRQGDLLFQGSISLPPASSSEVNIHLREGNRVCGLSRKYSQEDGSTIIVDGRKMRILDLDALKRDWHLEGDRFAFISQGEVSEVIQQRPLQRRTHLECIFGIDLYRKQREEASQRLDAAEFEMQRLMTLRSELQVRKDVIADSVIRARQAKAIIDVLERDRSQLYWIRRSRCETVMNAARQELLLLEDQRRTAGFLASGWKRAVDEKEKWSRHLARDLQDARDSVLLLENTNNDAKRELFTLGNVLHRIIERKGESIDDLSLEKKGLNEIDSRRERAEDDFRRSVKEEEKAKVEFLVEKEKWESHQRSLEEHSARIKAFREEDASCASALEDARAMGKTLGRALADARMTHAGILEKEKKIGTDLGKLEILLSSIRIDEEKARQKHRDDYAAFQKAAVSKQVLSRELTAAERDAESLRDSVFSKVYPAPVQHLLSAVRLGRLDASPRPLADVISCPEGLTTAIESYLGARQYLLFVRDINEAGRCIEHLRAKSAGRANFLPLERSRKRQPDRRISMDRKGVVGFAADLVGIDEEWEICALHVMGDLLIVESFEVARDICRNGFKGPVATLEGDVFQPGGMISGGKTSKAPGAIEIRRRLLEKEGTIKRIREEQEQLAREMEDLEIEEGRSSEMARLITEKRKRREEEAGNLASELSSIAREYAHVESRIKSIISGLGSCGKEQLKRLEMLAHLRGSVMESIDTSREIILVKLLEERRSQADLAGERLAAARRVLSMIDEEKKRSIERISILERNLEESRSSEMETLERLSEAGKNYFLIREDRIQGEARLRLLEKEHSAALSAQNVVIDRSALSANRFDYLSGRISQALQRAEAAESEIAESADMWEERFPYPGNGNIDTRDHDRIRKSVRDLEKNLREIGDVDIGVLSEDVSLTDRLSFLEEQLRDVGTGIGDLRKLIEETDRQAGVLFSTSLREIDKRFCSLFQRLFGGGEAHLRLADDGSVWNAGVEVIARPPGKRPQHLAQLSGGEQSLSAISLLFAAMEVAGVPLAVLDEVDASLDEVNLRRFSELAREYSKSMQLICMTHRRATMERADLMYGITMSEPGLSQVVGVRLEDWD